MVGAGRLARAILPALVAAGYPVVAVAARSLASARRAARVAPGAFATRDPSRAAAAARLVLLAVPDREIAAVASRLARDLSEGWRGRAVLHHAGALGTAPLRPLARRGAAVGVLHPLQVLGRPETASRLLPGSFARIEGDRKGGAAALRLAKDLGLEPLALRRRLSDRDRAAYHAAASAASNDVVALLSIGVELLVAAGARREPAIRALAALLRGAAAHAEAGGIGAALTGPVVRGDAATVATQVARLSRLRPEAAEAHRLLSLWLVRLARTEGLLQRGDAAALRRLLRTRDPGGPSRRARV